MLEVIIAPESNSNLNHFPIYHRKVIRFELVPVLEVMIAPESNSFLL